MAKQKQAPKPGSNEPISYEKWRLTKNGKEFKQVELLRENVLLLESQADTLNAQRENTLVEYVQAEAKETKEE